MCVCACVCVRVCVCVCVCVSACLFHFVIGRLHAVSLLSVTMGTWRRGQRSGQISIEADKVCVATFSLNIYKYTLASQSVSLSA